MRPEPRKKLGEMLVDAGLITLQQLNQAITGSKRADMKIGQFLIKQGVLNESKMVDLLSQKLKVERYRPEKYPIDHGLAPLIPAEMAKKHMIVPLKRKTHLITIGMTDPMDLTALDAVEALLRIEVDPVICTEAQFDTIFTGLYGQYTDMDKVLESMEALSFGKENDPKTEPGHNDIEAGSLKDMAEDPPVVRLVSSIIFQAFRQNASDIHLSPEKEYVHARFRVDGQLREVPAPPKSLFLPVVSRIKLLANMDISQTRLPQDGRFTVKAADKMINIRASTVPTIYGEKVVLRIMDTNAHRFYLDRLGMCPGDLEKVESVIQQPH
ncbi:MAG: ATPase, T2SS/T4P/T4SS family, partial [Desulfobacterales bacterium]|nr:ATPase, T2SS/T4P/T4SS family [Desulfobacterales bacterium]